MNNYPNGPYDPNNPYSQPTTAGPYPQFPPPPAQPQWVQQPPPPYPQPGQFGPPPMQPKPKEWYQQTSGIVICLFLFYPVGLYLMWKHARWNRNLKWTITGIFVFLTLVSGAINASASNTTSQPTQVMATPTPDTSPLETPVTDTPTPIATPTPAPTQAPVQQAQPVQSQPIQQQPPVQQPPPATGVYGNPWGYDFNPGSKIYAPNADFCNGVYFSCIASFANGTGYVEECGDGLYSKSGGRSGSCSKHGGDKATLYQHA